MLSEAAAKGWESAASRSPACLDAVSTQLALGELDERFVSGPKTASGKFFWTASLQANLHQGERAVGAKLAYVSEEPGYFAYANSNPLTGSDPNGLSGSSGPNICDREGCDIRPKQINLGIHNTPHEGIPEYTPASLLCHYSSGWSLCLGTGHPTVNIGSPPSCIWVEVTTGGGPDTIDTMHLCPTTLHHYTMDLPQIDQFCAMIGPGDAMFAQCNPNHAPMNWRGHCPCYGAANEGDPCVPPIEVGCDLQLCLPPCGTGITPCADSNGNCSGCQCPT
jgi:hypothetical protein